MQIHWFFIFKFSYWNYWFIVHYFGLAFSIDFNWLFILHIHWFKEIYFSMLQHWFGINYSFHSSIDLTILNKFISPHHWFLLISSFHPIIDLELPINPVLKTVLIYGVLLQSYYILICTTNITLYYIIDLYSLLLLLIILLIYLEKLH